ncbi:MAG TPA: VWA domain-containing protein, partial [Bryobacteraceae bacterium]|nr:VWA domain-containing protein [Bryobacteraceae bacterium]
MNFGHIGFLLLALAPVVWVALSWRRTARPIPLLLKGLSFAVVLVALSEPSLTLPRNRTAAVVLVDTSKSVTAQDLAHASSLVSQIEGQRGANWLKVIPFASHTRSLGNDEILRGVHLVTAPNPLGDSTNFEKALIDSMAAIPTGFLPRLVLLSDGNENQGSAARAIAELQRLHVPVDTIPLAGRSRNLLRLEAVSMPRTAYEGEQIPIDLTVYAPAETKATVEISAEGKSLGVNPASLAAGSNLLRVHARVKSSGSTAISGTVRAGQSGEAPFERGIQLRRAKVLYLSQDPSGADSNLLKALEEASFDVTRDETVIDGSLRGVQLVILNNLDLNNLADARKTRLEEYVKNGGGLLLIGGEQQVYKEDKRMDALDRALPAKLAPPKTPEGTTVVLIIDKSSSMEGRKIELARLSASGVVDHLRPIDNIGVLIFDNSFQWAVPIRRSEDRAMIKRLISGITPDGGTQIAPALTEAYHKVLPAKGIYKHVVLLTDGISEEGDSVELAKEAAAHEVTISTVGLGQDVNRAYLEKVASTSGGRSYFLNEPQGLEQILLKDVQDFSGSTAIEKSLTAIVDRKAEVLNDVGMENAPPLKGYARFVAVPGAETILSIDAAKRDPLYVRWQYGLGRAAVFTSDAKNRWADAWVTWPGFDKFWINVTRDLLDHAEPNAASAQLDAANDDILVTYRLAAGQQEPPAVPPVFVVGPEGFEKPLPLAKAGAGVYTGRTHIGNLRGLFRIRPVKESDVFPEIGFYRENEESRDYGSNEVLLKQISDLTGGRFNPSPAAVFDAGGRTMFIHLQLWPALLFFAIALTIAELIMRKWSGLVQR